MNDPGLPTSYLALVDGTPVVTTDGSEIGTVTHVLADPGSDVFDGLVVRVGMGHRFVDAPEVASIHEHEVRLTLDRAAADRLPEPTENPAAMRLDAADAEDTGASSKLRRAWDLLSGNY